MRSARRPISSPASRIASGPIAAHTSAFTAASDSRTTASTSGDGDAAAVDEPDGDAEPLELGRDLRSRPVHDDDVMTGRMEGKRLGRPLGRDATAELEHDPAHVVYSALMRT